MIPPWGHSQVPVTCVFRWCKYLFFVNSVLERKVHPRQNTALLLEWVHTSNSLTWIPTKTARKQGWIYMRSVLLSSTQASNTFTAEFHIHMLPIYCWMQQHISTGSWHKNTILVGLNMACTVFDMPENLIDPFKAKVPAMLDVSLGSQSCLLI